ncbi:hypothetical protein DFH08DRAFT_710798, partial [Mycena albidolilacea]
QWSDVMWSDECYVMIGGLGRIFVTRQPNEKWEEEFDVPKFSQVPIHYEVSEHATHRSSPHGPCGPSARVTGRAGTYTTDLP